MLRYSRSGEARKEQLGRVQVVPRQAVCHPEYPDGEELGVPRSITRHELAEGVQVIERLIRPGYWSHRAMRRRAFSCEIFRPASACATPRSILSKR